MDKPPFSLWAMELSARVFGLNSWSLLLPQAIAGVLTVLVTYLIVRRWFSAIAALVAGAVLALTPAAALMFRYDNPDAMLTLLLVLGAYALVRAIEAGRTAWLLAAGALIGFAFLTKSLQAFLVLPPFALVWLVAAPGAIGRRLWQMAAAAGTMLVAGGWWVAIVELMPAASRPYIGGSTDDSVLGLIFGYNGLDRLSGGGGPGGGGGGMGFSGSAGIGRLFNDQMGGQISWLLPFAAVGLVGRALGAPRDAPHRPDARGVRAVGRLGRHPRPGLQLHDGHRPHATTPWPWRRRWGRSWAWGASSSGGCASGRPRAGRCRWPSRRAACGPTSSWTGPPASPRASPGWC